jgi:hypothetical protein
MRYLTIALSALMLAACSETIMLRKPGEETAARGMLEFRFSSPHRLTVTLNGKAYEGYMDRKEADNSAELRARYEAFGRHLQKLSQRHSNIHHVHHYNGVLKAPDGATLTCEFLSSASGEKTGICEDAKGQVYEVSK